MSTLAVAQTVARATGNPIRVMKMLQAEQSGQCQVARRDAGC